MSESRTPLLSVITALDRPALDALSHSIESVLAQTFADWELICVIRDGDGEPRPDGGGADDGIRSLLGAAAAGDPRIRIVETGGPSDAAACNAGLHAARGQFIALLDQDGLLTPDALGAVAEAVELQPDLDYLYTDEATLAADGRGHHEFRKPDWSPERLRHNMYTGHLSVLRTALAREVGGFRPDVDGSHEHDLVLRLTERSRRITHLPQVLYRQPDQPVGAAQTDSAESAARLRAWQAGRRAVQEHLDRTGAGSGVRAVAQLGRLPGFYRVRRELGPDLARQRVSIVIPTRGQSGLVWGQRRCFVVDAVASALRATALPDVEVVVVYDDDTPAEVIQRLREIAGARLVEVPFSGEFNFSQKCNLGFLRAGGDVIVLLNDDVEVRSDGWLERLLPALAEPDVGLVGARLLFADGTIQHAGHAYADTTWHHPYHGFVDDEPGSFGDLIVNRECSGVTAACAALRRDVYERVGGLSEQLPVNFNDVDLSLKIRRAGYRVLWIADCELYHFESRTRDRSVGDDEIDVLRRRWGYIAQDPFLPDSASWRR